MMLIFHKWVKDDVVKLTHVNKQPTKEGKKDPKFCLYHRYVHHPAAAVEHSNLIARFKINFIALSRASRGSHT